MIPVRPAGPVTRGLDVSHYNGIIDFKRVKASGREFVWAKCSEYVADITYNRNRRDAKAAGLLFGAYHFFHPSRDPQTQAEKFLKLAGIERGDLVPMLDWEHSDGIPSYVDRSRAIIWLNTVEAAIGAIPIIYGSPYFLQALKLEKSFARYPLMISHYGVSAPLVPSPWETWTFWQHSERGDIPGIPALDEDLDMFNGTKEQLQQFTV